MPRFLPYQWRLSMVARRKVYHVNPAIDEALRNKIERTAIRESDLEAMRKDFCLIEAALATDKIVISLDEVVRTLFATAAGSVGEIRRVVWVNPDKTDVLLFRIESRHHGANLDNKKISKELRQKFEDYQILLSQDVVVSIQEEGSNWQITDQVNRQTYFVRQDKDLLNIYTEVESPIPWLENGAQPERNRMLGASPEGRQETHHVSAITHDEI